MPFNVSLNPHNQTFIFFFLFAYLGFVLCKRVHPTTLMNVLVSPITKQLSPNIYLTSLVLVFWKRVSTHSSKQDCHHSYFQVCALQCASHFPSPNMTTYNIVTLFGCCFFTTRITAHKKNKKLYNIKNLNTFFQDQASGHKLALKRLQEPTLVCTKGAFDHRGGMCSLWP
jgi:hypothetical protein